jgi:hypothetical protein
MPDANLLDDVTITLPAGPPLIFDDSWQDAWQDDGVQRITPDLARDWLKNVPRDNINRLPPARERKRVEKYKRDMLRGAWQCNPSSRFLLGKNDCVLDGKGRLQAVVDSGVTIWSYVSRHPQRTDATGLVVDQGVPRDLAYRLQIHPRLVSAGNLGFKVCYGRTPDAPEVSPFAVQFNETFNALNIANRGGLGASAPLHLAAMLAVASELCSADYAASVLTQINHRDPKPLSPLPYSLYRQIADRSKRLNQRHLLVRAYRALAQRYQNNPRLQIRDEELAVAEIRLLLQAMVSEWRA